MFKYPSRIKTLKKVHGLWRSQRYQSTKVALASGTKIGLASTLVIGSSGLGVIGYASWSPEKRKRVEQLIPGSSTFLSPILGPIIERPSKDSSPSKQEGLLQKKLEREKAKEEHKSIVNKSDTLTPVTSGSLAPSPHIEEITKDEVSPVTSAEEVKTDPVTLAAAAPLATSEVKENLDNESLSKLLKETMLVAQQQVTVALSSADEASLVIHQFAEKAYAAINSEGEEKLYEITAEFAKFKNASVKTAEENMAAVKKSMDTLQNASSSAQEFPLTKDNETLTLTGEFLSELKLAIREIESIVTDALKDSASVTEFQNLVEDSRKQFESEVRSLLPDVKVGDTNEKLSEEDLNLLLAHAHTKVMMIQKALAKQQTFEKSHLHDPPMRQRDHESRLAEGRMQAELDRQRHEASLDHRHRVAQMREDMENELRGQLKRQAAAHSDHLADMLHSQEKVLSLQFENKLADGLQIERDLYHKTLSRIDGNLKGLKTSLRDRAEADKAAYDSHELWMTCQGLKADLRLCKEDAHSWEEQLHPLNNAVDSIRKAAGDKNSFVETVLNALPERALSRGVYTESALRERFVRVERICRRVGMIDDNGGSLIRYLISYIRSFLIMDALESLPVNEIQNKEIDIDKLDTYDLLARTKHCLEKDDLLQSVRYMRLLRGEPKLAAADWVKEALMVLEARQVADALMAFAAATGARAL